MGGKNGVSFLFGAGRRGDGAPCEECGGQGRFKGGVGGRFHRPRLLPLLCVCMCVRALEHWSL